MSQSENYEEYQSWLKICIKKLTTCKACGQSATWITSDRDERNEPVDCCAFCGKRL